MLRDKGYADSGPCGGSELVGNSPPGGLCEGQSLWGIFLMPVPFITRTRLFSGGLAGAGSFFLKTGNSIRLLLTWRIRIDYPFLGVGLPGQGFVLVGDSAEVPLRRAIQLQGVCPNPKPWGADSWGALLRLLKPTQAHYWMAYGLLSCSLWQYIIERSCSPTLSLL